MPGPRRYSRHLYSLGFHDDEADGSEGPLQLTEREPYAYREFADNRVHVVAQGETLFTLAAKYLSPIPRAAGLWWIVADFQPDPIHDPTITLTPGSTIIVPSMRTVLESIFSDTRRLEAGL